MIKKFIVHTIAVFIAVYIVVNYLHFGTYDSVSSAIIFSGVLAIINGIVSLIPNFIDRVLGCLSFGLIPLIINIGAVLVAENLVPGFKLTGIFATIVLIILVSIMTGIVHLLVKNS